MITQAIELTFIDNLHQTYLSLLPPQGGMSQESALFHQITQEYYSQTNQRTSSQAKEALDRLYQNIRHHFPRIAERISLLFMNEYQRLAQPPSNQMSPATLEKDAAEGLSCLSAIIPKFVPPPTHYAPPQDITGAIHSQIKRLVPLLKITSASSITNPMYAEMIEMKSELARLLDVLRARRGETAPHPESIAFLSLTPNHATRWSRTTNPPLREIPAYLFLSPHSIGSTLDCNWRCVQDTIQLNAVSHWTKTLLFVEQTLLPAPFSQHPKEKLLTILKILHNMILGAQEPFRSTEAIIPFPDKKGAAAAYDLTSYPPDVTRGISEVLELRSRWGSFEAATPYFTTLHWKAFTTLGYIPPPPEKTGPLLTQFFEQLLTLQRDARFHPFQIATFIHHGLTHIHPFEKGNGQVARLFANIYLMQQGFLPLLIYDSQKYFQMAALSNTTYEQQFGNFIDKSLATIVEELQTSRLPRGKHLQDFTV